MLTFAYPWVLPLILVPLLMMVWRRRKPATISAPALPTAHWLQNLPGVSRHGQPTPFWQQLLLWLIWTLLVLGLARPQYVDELIQQPVTGRDLLLTVDISPSMEEMDMTLNGRSVNRLQAVKDVLDDFILNREGDRLGLVLFGSRPYVQAPLSFDHDTIRTLLNEARLGMAGRATAIGDAIGLGVKRLRNRPQEQRVMVLLTDGANTAGEVEPEKAADIAASAGVRIYTVGIGAERMTQQGILGSRTVNPSRDLDEALLQSIAGKTGGRYFRARNTGELQSIYDTIDQLEPVELDGQHYRPVDDLYVWPVGGALVLFLVLQAAAVSRKRSQEAAHG
ncbi:BatB protein [Tamilnaduibacter salinus]|uniref:BatB protein n=1 Tax=Tamilnaduibacter salinus TaxID=1484056 RepID=A0A2A2I404_9GAMM|nr:VWA domain-containing protein [Tamilnaduibacter salinus]PAV26449.1 BatB protein [Tamilnaduibacter salinus]